MDEALQTLTCRVEPISDLRLCRIYKVALVLTKPSADLLVEYPLMALLPWLVVPDLLPADLIRLLI
ncbi:MAG: hypothetical protein OHK0037_31240 [Elainellaceae cyanobacterium]